MPKMVGVRVWSSERARRIEDDLERLQLAAPDGHLLPLSRIADIKRIAGQPQIQREDFRRMVAVTARLSGTDLGSAIRRVRETLDQNNLFKVDAPGGGAVTYGLGGLFREQQAAFVGLLWVFGAAIVLLLALLVYWYESVRVALCLVLIALLALPGVALALWITDTQLNIASMMGFAMIAGSVVEAGVFLCSEVLEPTESTTRDQEDLSVRSRAKIRITAAALRRIRPISMTTIAAILAMVPLLVGLGQGSAMLRPLAVAIVAGLIVQLPLVLIVLPGLLFASGAVHRRINSETAQRNEPSR
jgi:multidrug efflux pump subunit AcrB